MGEPSLRDRTSGPPVGPEGGLDQQASRDHATTFDRIPRLGDGPISAGGDAAVDSGDRKLYPQAGPGTEGAVEEDPAAERLHAVLEANEAGAAAEIGTAGAVVVDGDAQDSVCGVGLDGDRERRGAGMLGRVGQRFGDDKVGRDLDRLRETAPRCARRVRPGPRSGGRVLSAQAPVRLRRGWAGECRVRARADHRERY